MYNIIYETSRQSRFDARYWMLGAGALGRPRGMVWGGQDELLALDVDVIDVVTVDDEASADTDEQKPFVAKLVVDHGLDDTQLIGEQTRLVVGQHDITVVAVRRNVDYRFGDETHHVVGC